MILEVEYVNVHTTSVGNGRSLPDNLRNVDDAEGRSIAARNVRRVLGYFTGTGVLLPRNNHHLTKRTPFPLEWVMTKAKQQSCHATRFS
jgi:hypothetical protein